ncbi:MULTISPECIES: methyltransferase [Halococcus]|uniref:rRNA (Guanine-N(2)-)-methyltransferase n=1 Tax=Halococcus salifodinae DSM 8989 TaxID=1227456 RepID=M0N0A8_9EURY|nr:MULTISPECIES: methyltransferase [Halococcus]EMA50095.1 rRNA (guanine-N(2)-)-methyltransferase [Halococcus salifodinae DSM 8989]
MKRAPYQLTLESRVADARPTYRFHTADGVHSKRSFRDAELLLVDALWNADLGHLLNRAANYGVVGTVLAGCATAVHMVESSARAAQLCERNAAENGADAAITLNADVTVLNETFDTVAYAPKPYTPISVGKQRLVDSLAMLRLGGTLYLAASKRSGLARYEACLQEVAATVERVADRNGCALLAATLSPSFEPPTYVSPRTIHPKVNGTALSLVTVPGLFSADKLDDGTRLLLETATIEDGETVLDLCCGYGAIGAYAGRVADCEVWLSDDDCVATSCAERSLRASQVDGTVVTADGVAGIAHRTFDSVLCNPPTHAGHGVLSELFAGIHGVLAADGSLTIVHHRELDLRNHLSRYGTVERRRTGTDHVVLSATA